MKTKSSLEKSRALDGVILAAVSGGADSIAMLHLLFNAVDVSRLYVLYVEHGIRGEESIEDGRFVEALCESLEIPFEQQQVDVPGNIRQGESCEEAARRLRYDALISKAVALKNRIGLPCYIATAHHNDDQAETVLFRMIRGTGVAGLKGIELIRPTDQAGVFLYRPMLEYTRAEIEEYLEAIGQDYRTDRTNLLTDYDRNKLRINVMPLLTEINSGAKEHIGQLASQVSELYGFLEDKAKESLFSGVSSDGTLLKAALTGKYRALDKEIIREYVAERTLGQKDITAEHYEKILELFSGGVGRSLSLPGGYTAARNYDGVKVSGDTEKTSFPETMIKLSKLAGGPVKVRLPEGELELCLVGRKEADYGSPITYTKYLDYDKITEDIWVRSRREGDYLVVDDEGHRQKLKTYFINQKVSADARDEIPLVCCGSHVLWAVGYRISALGKITESTKNVLKISFTREAGYEA